MMHEEELEFVDEAACISDYAWDTLLNKLTLKGTTGRIFLYISDSPFDFYYSYIDHLTGGRDFERKSS